MNSKCWRIGLLSVVILLGAGMGAGLYAEDDDEDAGQAQKILDLHAKVFDMFDEDDDGKLSEEEAALFYAWLDKYFDALPYDDVVVIYDRIHRYHPAFVRWAKNHGGDGDWAGFFHHLEKGVEHAREKHHEAHDKAREKHDEAHDKAREKHDEAHDKAKEKHDEAHDKAKEKHDEAHDKARDRREDAREKAKDRRDDAQDKAADKRGDAQDKAHEKRKDAQDKTGDKRDDAQDKAHEKRKAAQDKSSDWHKGLGDALDRDIKNRPAKAKKGGGGRAGGGRR